MTMHCQEIHCIVNALQVLITREHLGFKSILEQWQSRSRLNPNFHQRLVIVQQFSLTNEWSQHISPSHLHSNFYTKSTKGFRTFFQILNNPLQSLNFWSQSSKFLGYSCPFELIHLLQAMNNFGIHFNWNSLGLVPPRHTNVFVANPAVILWSKVSIISHASITYIRLPEQRHEHRSSIIQPYVPGIVLSVNKIRRQHERNPSVDRAKRLFHPESQQSAQLNSFTNQEINDHIRGNHSML